jgi:AraC family transcriptional regulator
MKRSSRIEYVRRINRLLDHISHNPTEEYNLNDMAEIANFSPFHFHRIFSALVGETPQDFIRRVRLEQAVLRMELNSKPNFTRIAIDCGFPSPAHFTKSFKRYFGVSPRMYKKSKKRHVFPDAKSYTLGETIPQAWEERNTEITVRTMPTFHVAYVRHIGEYDMRIGLAWRKLMKWAANHPSVNPRGLRISRSYDDPEVTPEGMKRYDACLCVDVDIDPEDEIGITDIEGGLYGEFRYEGPVAGIDSFFEHVFKAVIPDSGYDIRNAPIYRTHDEGSAEQMRRKCSGNLYIPLKPL